MTSNSQLITSNSSDKHGFIIDMSDFTKKNTTDSITDHDMIQLANRSFAKVVPLQIPQTS